MTIFASLMLVLMIIDGYWQVNGRMYLKGPPTCV